MLGRNIPQRIWNKRIYKHITSPFYLFVLYLVKTSSDFYGIQFSIIYTSLPQARSHRMVPSPDLIPVDYSLWRDWRHAGALSTAGRHCLLAFTRRCWSEPPPDCCCCMVWLQQHVIDDAIMTSGVVGCAAVWELMSTIKEETTSASSLTIFCQRLETWLFRHFYPDLIIPIWHLLNYIITF